MNTWQRKAGVAAALIALMSISACAASAGSATLSPPSGASPSSIAGPSGGGCEGVAMDVRHAAYWYSRAATDLNGVVLPQPDCIRDGRSGEVTLIWLKSNPGFLLTLDSAFVLAGWYETSTSSDLVSFLSPDGTSVSASYVRLGYADSEEPYVALAYVRGGIPPAPGSSEWEN